MAQMACELHPPSKPTYATTIKLSEDFHQSMGRLAQRNPRRQPIGQIQFGKSDQSLKMDGKTYEIRKNPETRLTLVMQDTNLKEFFQIGDVGLKLVIRPVLTSQVIKDRGAKTSQYLKEYHSQKSEILDDRGRKRRHKRPLHGNAAHYPQSKKPRGRKIGKGSIIERLIHLLILQPLPVNKIISQLDIKQHGSKLVEDKIKQVATYNYVGKYELKTDQYCKIDPHWPEYSEAERRAVQAKIQEFEAKKQQFEAKKQQLEAKKQQQLRAAAQMPQNGPISPLNGNNPAKPPTKHRKKRSVAQQKPPLPRDRGTRRASTTFRPTSTISTSSTSSNRNSPFSTSTQYTKLENKYAVIDHYNVYKHYKKLFNDKFKNYEKIKNELEENASFFQALGKQLGDTRKRGESKSVLALKERISVLYKDKCQHIEKRKTEYNVLHVELSILKGRVKDYVEKMEALS